MKRPFIIFLYLFFHFCSEGVAAEQNKKLHIVVGSELDYPPYALTTKDGQADGFSVDLMKAVCRVMEIKVAFRVGPWSEVRAALEQGEIDALPLVSYSNDRENLFDFTVPHTVTHGVIFKRKDHPGIHSATDLRGKKIIVMRSDAGHDWLLRNDISENLTLTKTVAESLSLLAAGKYDFALVPHLVGIITAKKLNFQNIEITGPLLDAYGRGFGFAVKEGNLDLLRLFNNGLSIVKETGEYGQIYQKWFGNVDPKGISSELVIQYTVWAVVGFIVLSGLAFTWIMTLRRAVVSKTIALEQAKTDAENANKAKSEFLASMSHDLRTPLNAMMGFSEIMSLKLYGPLGDARYDNYASDIHQSGSHLISLIDDILDLSKIEAGKYVLNEEVLDIAQLIHTCVNMISTLAHLKNLDLTTDIPPDLPRVYADERAMMQIFNNLLSNAVKFTPENGHVTVSAKLRDEMAIDIVIADTGIGMSRIDITKALKPFEQADSTHAKHHEGTGLGLHLCQKLVKMHGGELVIKSEEGVGTTFTVHMPPERTC